MNLVAVCISKQPEQWLIPEVPFYCHTSGYRPILHHDNNDMTRITYLTDRYNQAVEHALREFPETEEVLIVDSYYLRFVSEIRTLIERYFSLGESIILGASIWYWDKSHLRACIRYYDTLSVRELRNKKWYSLKELPIGLLNVSGVGGCFLFPRSVWEISGGFFIPHVEPQAGGSRCLKVNGYRVLLQCDCKLWRTSLDNRDVPDYPVIKRLRISVGELRRRIIRV